MPGMTSVEQQQASHPLLAEEVASFKSWGFCHAQSVSVDCQDSKGRTALMFAAIAGDVLIVHKLLKIGAKVNVITYQGHSALDYAVLHRCQGCAAALADEGACLQSQTVQELELLLHPSRNHLLQHQEAGIACYGAAAVVAIPTPFESPYRKRIVVLSKHGNLFHRSPDKPVYDPEHIQLRNREVRRCSVPELAEQLCTDAGHMHLGTDIVTIASHQGKGVRIWFSSSIEAHVMESHLLAAQKQAAMLLMNASQQHLIRIAIQNFLLSLTAPQALMTAHVPSCIMTDTVVEDSPPELTVAQLLSDWQAPMSDQAQQELLRSMGRNAQQEANIISLAQQLHQVQQVIKADVTPATDFIDTRNALEDALGKAASRQAQNQLKLSAAQAQLQAASPESGDLCSADLPKTKEIAEQAIQHYLKVASTILEGKLEALPTQRQHRTNILQQLLSARLSITMPELSNIPSWSTAEVQQHNEAQLQASLVLSAAFDDTRKARAHLQHCLDKESCLMESRNSPLQQGLTQSAHLMQHTIAALQQQDLDEDQQQAEAMLRDNQLQQHAQALLLQTKANARTVISEVATQRQKQKDLSKQIARATADREELLIDGKQIEADRVTQKLATLSASRAALNAQMDTQTQMLASPDLLSDHPELKWEIRAAAQAPSLGVAQQLYIKDRKLTDFRIISHPAATILEAEDKEGRVWALKRVQGDQQSVREAERMVKLHGHPLIVHLQSVFVDGTAVHLQMPFYRHGNLRSWVEQIKAAVQSTGTLSAMQKAAVRSTMRQLAQAIAYTHQHGVAHRDIKPENVLLQDNGNIALCDFGISKDIINGAYESTMHLAGAAGTLAYCAPEAGGDAWKQIPTALDTWSFGMMLLELVSGMLFSWDGDKVASQPNQLEPAQTLTRKHLPSSDVWFSGAWHLIHELLQKEPSNRPSMDSVLLCPFFTSDRFAASALTLERKFRVLTAHLNSIRQSANRTPAYIFTVHSEQSVIPDILDVFSDKQIPLHKMFHVQWGPNSVRKPLQEVMDMFLSQLTTDTSPTALFQQCDQPSQLLRSYLPPAQPHVSYTALQQYEACGRVLAKCVLEGIHIPVTFSVALHCVLVNAPVNCPVMLMSALPCWLTLTQKRLKDCARRLHHAMEMALSCCWLLAVYWAPKMKPSSQTATRRMSYVARFANY